MYPTKMTNVPGSNPPPAHIESDELLNLMMQVSLPHMTVDYPVNDASGKPMFQMEMVMLSHDEAIAVQVAVEKQVRKVMGDTLPKAGDATEGYNEVYNNIAAPEILFRCCRYTYDLSRRVFPSKEFLSKYLSSDHITILWRNYCTLQIEQGPILSRLTQDDADQWLKRFAEVAEGGQYNSAFLDSLSWAATKDLLIIMAARLHSLETVNTSPGSLQEGTSPKRSKAKPAQA